MSKAFIVDLDRCVGCFACEIACKDENDLAAGIRHVKVKSVDSGECTRFYVPVFALDEKGVKACTLCPQLQAEGRKPACVHNCLTNALFFGEEAEMLEKSVEMRSEKIKVEQLKASVIYLSDKPISERLLSL